MAEQKNKTVPTCVGIIMDGNRRWAKEKGLQTFYGHKAGYEKLKDVVSWAQEVGVKNLIFYAFSTENWNRTKKEVGYLMDIFKTALSKEFDEIKKKNVSIRFIGQRERFKNELCLLMDNAEKETAHNTAGSVVFALSYGGRAEIVDAVNKIITSIKHDISSSARKCPSPQAWHSSRSTSLINKNVDEPITEESFQQYLWTAGIPDPDIIIRTGGERRLSNFLTWQSVYSELFFTDTYWPDFNKKEFINILKQFVERERRQGK